MGDLLEEQGFVSSAGLTAKQESFALHLANGETQADAYRLSYDCTNSATQTIYSEASILASNPKVAARVAHLLNKQMDKMLRDAVSVRRHVFKGLMAESTAEGKASDRIKALELLGKMDFVSMFGSGQSTIKDGEHRTSKDALAELMGKLEALSGSARETNGTEGT